MAPNIVSTVGAPDQNEEPQAVFNVKSINLALASTPANGQKELLNLKKKIAICEFFCIVQTRMELFKYSDTEEIRKSSAPAHRRRMSRRLQNFRIRSLQDLQNESTMHAHHREDDNTEQIIEVELTLCARRQHRKPIRI
jgi:hypothetical protein